MSSNLNIAHLLKPLLVLLITGTLVFNVTGQDLLEGQKIWNGLSLSKSFSPRVTVDFDGVVSQEMKGLSTSFVQSRIAVGYKISKPFQVQVGYGIFMLPWNRNFEQFFYNQNIFGGRSFQDLSTRLVHKFKISPSFKVKQRLITQLFIPTVDKYKIRFNYRFKLYYRNKNLPMKMKPFSELGLYYYQGGVPIFYREGDSLEYGAPNGLHRTRLKLGVIFKPFEKIGALQVMLYYMLQKEFNLPFMGNPLNVQTSDIDAGDFNRITYPFNNYGVWGIHLLVKLPQKTPRTTINQHEFKKGNHM